VNTCADVFINTVIYSTGDSTYLILRYKLIYLRHAKVAQSFML